MSSSDVALDADVDALLEALPCEAEDDALPDDCEELPLALESDELDDALDAEPTAPSFVSTIYS